MPPPSIRDPRLSSTPQHVLPPPPLPLPACVTEGNTSERPHRWTAILDTPETVQVVPRTLLEQLANTELPNPSPEEAGSHSAANEMGGPAQAFRVEQKQALARAYVAKMEPAIEWSGGDRQTYLVACRLVKDFDLTPEQALPLLLEYNARCQPPWTEEMLRRKLEYADKRKGKRGSLLRLPRTHKARQEVRDLAQAQPATPTEAPPFLGWVPNFILADWNAAASRPLPRNAEGRLPRGRRRLMSGLLWLLRGEVIRQRRSVVSLPDVVMAQVVWGASQCLRNWRQQLRNWLSR